MPHTLLPARQASDRLQRPPEGLSRQTLMAEKVWRYIGDVLEGGHLHFFVTGGSLLVPETLAALHEFRADAYVPVLSDAAMRWTAKPRQSQYSLCDLMNAVAAQEFADSDRLFFSCSPPWQVCLQSLHHELHRRDRMTGERHLFGEPGTQ